MNYNTVYYNIINRAILELRIKGNGTYFENHHIIPKCIGGNNESQNMVLLTPKEHYLCHRLLVEMYPGNSKIKYAYYMFCGKTYSKWRNRDYVISSSEYDRIKRERSVLFVGKNHPSFGSKRTEECKQLMRELKLGVKQSDETISKRVSKLIGRKMSEDSINKTRLANIGKKRSPEALANIKNAQPDRRGSKSPLFGRFGEDHPAFGSKHVRSEEFKEKQREAWANRKIHKCIHCGYESKSVMNMNKWHNDNCRHRIDCNIEKIKCPHCSVESFNEQNMIRYHFYNCKNYKNVNDE